MEPTRYCTGHAPIASRYWILVPVAVIVAALVLVHLGAVGLLVAERGWGWVFTLQGAGFVVVPWLFLALPVLIILVAAERSERVAHELVILADEVLVRRVSGDLRFPLAGIESAETIPAREFVTEVTIAGDHGNGRRMEGPFDHPAFGCGYVNLSSGMTRILPLQEMLARLVLRDGTSVVLQPRDPRGFTQHINERLGARSPASTTPAS